MPPTADELEYAEDEEVPTPGPASPHFGTGAGHSPLPPAQPTLFFTPPKDDKVGLRRRRKGNAAGGNI